MGLKFLDALKSKSSVQMALLMEAAKHMRQLRRVVSSRNYNDPFICAHTDSGILVFTRWGEEANDSIIKKYEELEGALGAISDKLKTTQP